MSYKCIRCGSPEYEHNCIDYLIRKRDAKKMKEPSLFEMELSGKHFDGKPRVTIEEVDVTNVPAPGVPNARALVGISAKGPSMLNAFERAADRIYAATNRLPPEPVLSSDAPVPDEEEI